MSYEKHDPLAQYTAAEDEWTALQTLAAQSDPARVISEEDWRASLFASEGAGDTFARLATAPSRQVVLPPERLREALANAPLLDADGRQALRVRLTQQAQARAVVSVSLNIVENMKSLDAQGDLGHVATLASAARSALDGVATMGAGQRVASATLGALTSGYWDRVNNRPAAMPTGLGKIDDALGGGLQAGRLITLLGAPGGGKTTLANQWAEHIADSGRPVVYLTLEDSPDTLLAKTLARVGGLDYSAALHGYASQRAVISQALATVAHRRSAARLLYVEDVNGLTLADVKSLAASHFARYDAAHDGGAGVLIVDYLQRLARAQRGPDARDDLRIVVGKLAEDLRVMARDLGCCVIAIASMNRASGYGKDSGVSTLASAKEAGDIEYTADVLMALTDGPELVSGHQSRLLRIDKNRLGHTGTIALDWYPARQTFTQVADK